jgi:hypothetical protein
MRKIVVREHEASSTGATIATILVGAVAGLAVGIYVAQRVGGFSGLAARLRPRRKSGETRAEAYYAAAGEDFLDEAADLDDDELEEDDEVEYEGEYDDDNDVEDEDDDLEDEDDPDEDESGDTVLEEHVLEAFNNDPILSERAIDIGALGPGDIELEGWVDDDREAEHAMVIARGVPGVKSVANRLMVDDEPVSRER